MRTEAKHALAAIGLSFIVTYLHSMAIKSGMAIPEEIERRIEDMKQQQEKIYPELIYARALQQFRAAHKR